MRRWILVTLVVILSFGTSVLLLNRVNEFFDNKPFNINKIFDNAVFVALGNFVDKNGDDLILLSSHDTKLKIKVFDSNESIHSIKYTSFEKSNIINNKMWVYDLNNDSLNEIYFFYTDNDSLSIVRIDPSKTNGEGNYISKFYVDNTYYKNENLNHSILGVEMLDTDLNGDEYKDIIILYGTRFSHPRGIIALDVKNNTLIKRISSACIPVHITKYYDKYIISYRGPHNGVNLGGEVDNACKIEIRDKHLNLFYDTIFTGYSLMSTSIDTSSNLCYLLMFSHFNPDKFPSMFISIDITNDKIIKKKVIKDINTEGNQILVDNLYRGKIVGREDEKIVIYNENGDKIKLIDTPDGHTPTPNTIRCSGVYYFPMLDKNLIFTYTDQSYLYDLNGKLQLKSKDYLYDIEGGLFRSINNPEQHLSSFYLADKNINYIFTKVLIYIAIFIITIMGIFVVILLLKYLWISDMYRFLSVSSEKPAFILFRSHVLSMNNAGNMFLSKNNNAIKILQETFYRKKTFVINNEYYQIEFIKRNIFGIRFKAIVMENMTKDIENAQFKALFDKISLLNHNIKNSMTSLLAKKEIILLQEKNIPQYIIDYFSKVDIKANEITEISKNIMNLAIGNIEKKTYNIDELITFINNKYFGDVRVQTNNIREFYADWRLIKYVIENIVDNAVHEIKNDKHGFVEIKLNSQSNSLIIEIYNNGPSLTQNEIDKIMQGGYTTKLHGSGYGVFVSKNIVSRLNGDLKMESVKGKGVTVMILLQNALKQENG